MSGAAVDGGDAGLEPAEEFEGRRERRTPQVLAAVRRLLAAHGRAAVRARPLSARANVVVALDGLPAGAHPLVVRSPTRTDLLAGQDPADPWRHHQELGLARRLAGRGAPVVPPATDDDVLPAGPHLVDGLVLTVWRAGRPPRPHELTPQALGSTLRALHDAGRGDPGAAALPPLGPVAGDLDLLLATAARLRAADPGLLARLHEARAAVTGPLLAADRTTWQAVHGDAHPGNVLVLDGRLVWNDLEDACLAPPAWDLGTLRSSARTDGAAALRAYAAAGGPVPDVAALAAWVAARDLQRAAWTALRARTPAALAEVHALLDGLLAA
ncbi:aminoglycoside phosphotransferase family protein [Kineosporia sp. R_H_3]|uniref:phosphotransferase n=1 Tax=Kineosporia sp. R_H_3 TaxID=1961848 RepID=UPI00130466CE|nr:aminoglycoside phosphotransferase family protein [Kineosporia sp. R_H_3]